MQKIFGYNAGFCLYRTIHMILLKYDTAHQTGYAFILFWLPLIVSEEMAHFTGSL